MSTSPLIFDSYVVHNLQGKRILDIGCGYGKWGHLVKKYRWEKGVGFPEVVGLDAFEPHVESLKKQNIYDDVIHANAVKLPFKDNEFDSIIACEILEHLNKEEGLIFVRELKRVARLSYIVTTPNRAKLRPGGETIDGFNEYEAHKSSYSFQDFKALGFTQVVGVGHFKSPSWRLGVALSSFGFLLPQFSRYFIGFWFADGYKRVLYHE